MIGGGGLQVEKTRASLYLNPAMAIAIFFIFKKRGCRGRDRIVIGFTTTCAISAYHH